jgi:hypothetical protein
MSLSIDVLSMEKKVQDYDIIQLDENKRLTLFLAAAE